MIKIAISYIGLCIFIKAIPTIETWPENPQNNRPDHSPHIVMILRNSELRLKLGRLDPHAYRHGNAEVSSESVSYERTTSILDMKLMEYDVLVYLHDKYFYDTYHDNLGGGYET